jgi:AhpC/TSA family protein
MSHEEMMRILTALICVVLPCLDVTGCPPDSGRGVVIYNGTVSELKEREKGTTDLWISPAELTRTTRLVLKPEGVCDDKSCMPIPPARKQEFLKANDGKTWFNLSEFARLLKQPAAHDAKHGVWCFGPRPEAQNGHVATRIAPDFTLPDMQGKPHSLSDFRGKKVLLLTWASW